MKKKVPPAGSTLVPHKRIHARTSHSAQLHIVLLFLLIPKYLQARQALLQGSWQVNFLGYAHNLTNTQEAASCAERKRTRLGKVRHVISILYRNGLSFTGISHMVHTKARMHAQGKML
jgi:hypothetical protein